MATSKKKTAKKAAAGKTTKKAAAKKTAKKATSKKAPAKKATKKAIAKKKVTKKTAKKATTRKAGAAPSPARAATKTGAKQAARKKAAAGKAAAAPSRKTAEGLKAAGSAGRVAHRRKGRRPRPLSPAVVARRRALAERKAKRGPVVRVQYYRSVIGFDKKQKSIVAGLGFRRLNAVRELPDTASVRGMIARIPHLVRVLPDPA